MSSDDSVEAFDDEVVADHLLVIHLGSMQLDCEDYGVQRAGG